MSTLQFIRTNFRFLAFGFLLTTFCNFGQTFFIGLYNNDIRESYRLSNGDFGALYGLATLCSATVLVWLGRLIDHVDLRYYTIAAIVAMSCACLIMWNSGHIFLLFFVLFLLRLTGQGMMPHISNTSMGRYFEAARGRAVSIAMLGISFGQMILPGTALFLVTALGWRESWFVYALVLAGFVLPLALFLLRGHGARHQAWEAEITLAEAQSGSHSRMEASPYRTILRDPRFYLIMAGLLGGPLFGTAFFFFQETLILEKGWEKSILGAGFPLFAIATTGSALGSGFLIDKLGQSLKILPFSYLPFVAAMVLLFFAQNAFWLPVAMLLIGLTMGSFGTMGGTLWPELYGTKSLGSVRSLVTALMVLSTAVTPAVLGYVYDSGVSIEASYLGFAAYMFLACLIQLPLAFSAGKVKREIA